MQVPGTAGMIGNHDWLSRSEIMTRVTSANTNTTTVTFLLLHLYGATI